MQGLGCFASFYVWSGFMKSCIIEALERTPIIAATDRAGWQAAVSSDTEVLFHLGAGILTAAEDIAVAKSRGKAVFVHMDLTDGIGKDKYGVEWLKSLGADGIISTRSQLIRAAHDCGLAAVQRFFVLDSKGMTSISEMLEVSRPDLMEIMPGVIPKALCYFSSQSVPVIAGGLIETKQEVTAALSVGALAVSTGKKELWNNI